MKQAAGATVMRWRWGYEVEDAGSGMEADNQLRLADSSDGIRQRTRDRWTVMVTTTVLAALWGRLPASAYARWALSTGAGLSHRDLS